MKEFYQTFWMVLIISTVGYSNGRQITVSQASFGAALGRLISSTYDSLLKEIDGLQPSIESCTPKITNNVDTCTNCISEMSCERSSRTSVFLQVVKAVNPTTYVTTVRQGLGAAGSVIQAAAKAIYEKYGDDAVNALKDGFRKIGGVGITISNGIQRGVDEAKNIARKAAEIVRAAADAARMAAEEAKRRIWNPISNFFGKRRRRSTLLPQLNLPKLTEEQKRCLGQCPACDHFLSGDILQIMRSVCGNSFGDQLEAVYRKTLKYTELVKEWESTANAKRDLLKEIWVDTSTFRVSKIVVWKGGQYITYYPTTSITVDMFNHGPMYDAVALWIMNSY